VNFLFGFSGRIGRGQWWLGQLAMIGILVGCVAVVIGVGGFADLPGQSAAEMLGQAGWSIVAVIVATSILVSWVNIATTVKRFHDRDKSGFWAFIVLVPYIGVIWQIVECGFLPGSRGSNSYGSGGGGGLDIGDFGLDDASPAVKAEIARLERMSAKTTAPAPAATQSFKRAQPSGFGRRGL
jgi:uncharacterized membrane protein YhaH (DUF805 family)